MTFLKNAIQDVLPLVAKGTAGQLEIVVFSVLFIIFLQYARSGIVPFVERWLPRPQPKWPEQADPLERRPQPTANTTLLRVEGAVRRFGGLVPLIR